MKNLTISKKKIGLVIGVVVIILLVIFGMSKLLSYSDEKKLCDAAYEEIKDVMASYELNDYEVMDAGGIYGQIKIVCEQFDDLSNKQKLDVIKDIEDTKAIEVNDEEIRFKSCYFYISKRDYKNNENRYYYVDPAVLWNSEQVDCGGLYISGSHSGMTCLYPEY